MYKVIYESVKNYVSAREFKTSEEAQQFVKKIENSPLLKKVYPIVYND